MQTVDGFTHDETVALIESVHADVDAGVTLLDTNLTPVRELDLEPSGSSITYTADQSVRHRCTLVLAEEVDWGTARLRPWTTVYDGPRTITVQLGVYRPSLPETVAGDEPRRWTVDGYALTVDLARPHGETVRIATGASFITAAADLCATRGLSLSVAGAGEAKVATRDRVWPVDASISTLDIVDAMLGEAGYSPVWMRWDGELRSEPARNPADRSAEWTYDAQHERTSVGPFRTLDSNRDETPNRLIAISSAATAWDPVSGDGVHKVEDADSIAAEGLRVKVAMLDAVDQVELVAAAERKFAEWARTVDTVAFDTLPQPLGWHDDVVKLRDTGLGMDRKVHVTGWTYQLDGGLTQLSGVGL